MALDESPQPGVDEEFSVGEIPFVVEQDLLPHIKGALVDFRESWLGKRFLVRLHGTGACGS